MSPIRTLPSNQQNSTVPDALLKKYGGEIISLEKGEFVFEEGEKARSFFVVKRGQVKMINVSDEGKEFVQGYFYDGESFGEPPFFTEDRYPASAVADVRSEIWKIGRADFVRLLKENFDIHLSITQTLGTRLIYKSIMLSEIAIEEAEHRIRTLLASIRQDGHDDEGRTVPFSRQQIADMTGLRVETVIRIIKNLEHKGVVELTKKGKIVIH